MNICHIVSQNNASAASALQLVKYANEMGHRLTLIAPEAFITACKPQLPHKGNIHLVACRFWTDYTKASLLDLATTRDFVTKLYKAGPFDVIHVHGQIPSVMTCLFGIFLNGRVVYSPEDWQGTLKTKFPRIIEIILGRLTRRVITVSENERGLSKNFLIPMEKVACIPLPADIQGGTQESKESVVQFCKDTLNLYRRVSPILAR